MSIFLLIDGLNGGSTDPDHLGWFEIGAFSLGSSSQVTDDQPGLPFFTTLEVALLGLSPELFSQLADAEGFTSIRIQQVTDSGDIVHDLTLGEVFLAANQVGAAGGVPTSSLSFNYNQIELVTPDGAFGYDRTADSEINTGTIDAPSVGGADVLETDSVVQYFLTIDGENGGATAPGQSGAFEIESWVFGANRALSDVGVSGREILSDISVSLTGLTTELLDEVSLGETISGARIEGVNAAGEVVYEVLLGEALLSSDSIVGTEGAPPSTLLSFSTEQIGIITPSGNFGYDFFNRQDIDPTSIALPVPAADDSLEQNGNVDYFLSFSGATSLDGGKGATVDTDTSGWIEISSLQYGVSNGSTFASASPSNFMDVTLTFDGISPDLLTELSVGDGLDAAVIVGVDRTTNDIVYDLRLEDTLITSNSFSLFDGSASSSISIGSFDQFGLLTPLGDFGFDIDDQLEISTASLEALDAIRSSGPDSAETTIATQYFLRVDGISGDASLANSKGWFEIDSVSVGAISTVIDGTVLPTFLSDLDLSLAGIPSALLAELATGDGLNAIQIQGLDSSGNLVHDLLFNDVSLTRSDVSASPGLSATSFLSFDFVEFGFTTSDSSFGYNVDTETAIDPAFLDVPVVTGLSASENDVVDQYYLAIEGLSGDGGGAFKGWFEIDTLSFGAIALDGDANFPPVRVTLEGVSPELFEQLAFSNGAISVQIQGVNSTNNVVYDLRLGDTIISTSSIELASGGQFTSLTFDFDEIGLTTAAGSFGYSVSTDTEILATDITAAVPDFSTSALQNGATQYFLLVDNIDGGATAQDFEGWFEIDDITLGALTTGNPLATIFQDISVNLPSISPELFAEISFGEGINAIRIAGIDGTGEIVQDIRLENVFITTNNIGGSVDFSSTFTFQFGKIGLITPNGSFGLNVETGEAIAATDIALPNGNADPVGNPDATLANGLEDETITILASDLLSGFSDPDGDDLSVEGLTASSGEIINNGGGTFTLTAPADFNGLVTLTYGVSDGAQTLAGQTQSLIIDPVNDAPVAITINAATDEDTALNGQLKASDVDGDDLTFGFDTDATDGEVDVQPDGSFTYTPNSDFNGTDTFSYSVTDGTETITQTVMVSVVAANDAPIGAPDATLSNGTEDVVTVIAAADLLSGFSDPDADDLSIEGLTASSGTIVDIGAGTFILTTPDDFNGPVTLTYGVSDGAETLVDQTQSLTIDPVNDAASIGGIATGNVFENSLFPATGTLAITDVDLGEDQFATPASLEGDFGTFTFDTLTGEWTYALNNALPVVQALDDGDMLTDTLAVASFDGTATETIDITINGVTDDVADTIAPDIILTDGNILIPTDPGLATGTFVEPGFIATDNVDGVITGNVMISAPAQFVFGENTVTYTVQDTAGNTDIETRIVTVIDNQSPIFSSPPGDIVVGAGVGEAGAIVSFDAPTAIDNVGINEIVQTTGPASGEIFLIGISTVTYRASDTSGNIASVSFTVDVRAGVETGSLVVTTLSDIVDDTDGLTSLREAVAFANNVGDADGLSDATDTITFDAGLKGGTITLGGTELTLFSNITVNGDIDGNGSADITLDGDDASAVIYIENATGDASLNALNIVNGNGSSGGGIANFGTLALTNSTLSGNTALEGGGLFNGGTVETTNSTFLDNFADARGGGIMNQGIATVINTTVADNETAGDGAGIFQFGTTLELINSTVTGNSAVGRGGGIEGIEQITLDASIILGNTASLNDEITGTPLTPNGPNIIGDGAINLLSVFETGLLADNGGPVQTIALAADVTNPALDIGSSTLATDATGGARDVDLTGVDNGGTVDAGAVELQDQIDTPDFVFNLIDTGSETEAAALFDGAVIDPGLVAEGFRSITANYIADGSATNDDGSLFLALLDSDGNTVNTRTENVIPYALFGDSNGNFFNPKPLLEDGTYTLSVIAYSGNNRGGEVLGEDTITFTIGGPPNTIPVATDETVTIDEDASVAGNVLANDMDADSDTLTAALISDPDPSVGELSFQMDGSYTFTPAANVNGVFDVDYEVSDGRGGTAGATLTISVLPVQDLPVAMDDEADGPQDMDISGNVLTNDTDADGDDLTALLTSDPDNGEVMLNPDGSYTYTPDAGFVGTDSFTYDASDGLTPPDRATVNITVTAANTAPVVANPGAQLIDEGEMLSLQILASDAEDDRLEYSATLADGSALPDWLAIDSTTGLLSAMPGFENAGTFAIKVSVDDGDAASVVEFELTVDDVPSSEPVTITAQVSIDGEQSGNKRVDAKQGGRDNDLEIGGNDTTGLIFENIEIPDGAIIQSATLTLTSQRGQNGADGITIELLNNADLPSALVNGILTSAGLEEFGAVTFNQGSLANNEAFETPDLTDLVQQLIDGDQQDDGTYDLLFALSADQGILRIEAEEFGDDVAAELTVTYLSSEASTVEPVSVMSLINEMFEPVPAETFAMDEGDAGIIAPEINALFAETTPSPLFEPFDIDMLDAPNQWDIA